METISLFLIGLIFIVSAALMFFRVIPALLALPVMAFLIPLVSGVLPVDVFQLVIGQGAVRLAEPYTIAFFGSMLSILMQKTGIAEGFIKIGAELSGDKPFLIALSMMILIALLFTTLGGLGAIIMVAAVVLPILASVGLSAVSTAGIFLIGISLGGILNAGNWAIYKTILGLNFEEVRSFALIMFAVTFIAGFFYIIIQIYRDGIEISAKSFLSIIFLFIAISAAYFGYKALVLVFGYDAINLVTVTVWKTVKLTIGFSIIALLLFSGLKIVRGLEGLWWGSYLTPVIPLLLILLFDMNIIASFIIGLIYAAISTYRKNSLNVFLKSILEGGAVVMPAVALMFGIGMLLNAMMGPPLLPTAYKTGWPVLTLLKPVMLSILPKGFLSYVVMFGLMAPLALYRGPLNVWGMGYGIAAVFLAGGLNPGAIMGILLAVGQIQGISDPTNTQNVWLANELRVDVQKLLWNTLPYTWLIALIGLIIAASKFMTV